MTLPATVLNSLPADCWPAEQAPYLQEWRGLFSAVADAVACPQSTEQVAVLMQACHAAHVAVVPQGGNTSLVGGSVPYTRDVAAKLHRPDFDANAYQGVIVLNLQNLNKVRELDADNFTMSVDAGVVLADVQAAAKGVNRYFPLSVASENQCQIGGNLASNCGGINVLRYGNTRDLVLGLEAVTADGRILNQMTALRKNNMGYSLTDLLVGSEGTLAVITGAVLKLFPRPLHNVTVLLALQSSEDSVSILAQAREMLGDQISGCELMSKMSYDFAMQHGEACKSPFRKSAPWYLLLEFRGFEASLPGQVRAFVDLVSNHFELKAVVALKPDESAALWHIRKSIPAAQSQAGASIKHDVSVPVSKVPELLRRGAEAATNLMPSIRPCPFGHLGDGNLHFNLSQPEDMSREEFLAEWQTFNRLIHDVVAELGGSVAAEHGVGQMKVGELERYADPTALQLMASVKKAFDPLNILNPGKLLGL